MRWNGIEDKRASDLRSMTIASLTGRHQMPVIAHWAWESIPLFQGPRCRGSVTVSCNAVSDDFCYEDAAT